MYQITEYATSWSIAARVEFFPTHSPDVVGDPHLPVLDQRPKICRSRRFKTYGFCYGDQSLRPFLQPKVFVVFFGVTVFWSGSHWIHIHTLLELSRYFVWWIVLSKLYICNLVHTSYLWGRCESSWNCSLKTILENSTMHIMIPFELHSEVWCQYSVKTNFIITKASMIPQVLCAQQLLHRHSLNCIIFFI